MFSSSTSPVFPSDGASITLLTGIKSEIILSIVIPLSVVILSALSVLTVPTYPMPLNFIFVFSLAISSINDEKPFILNSTAPTPSKIST